MPSLYGIEREREPPPKKRDEHEREKAMRAFKNKFFYSKFSNNIWHEKKREEIKTFQRYFWNEREPILNMDDIIFLS